MTLDELITDLKAAGANENTVRLAMNCYELGKQEQAQKQEPVAKVVLTENLELPCLQWLDLDKQFEFKGGELLYTSQPQRQPLTSQERDAHRWRFLMENSYDSESVTQFHVWEHSWEPHSQTGEPTEWKQRVRGIALIDFIDRAIEAAHGIKGEA